jgi:hypothetical protein
VKWSLASLFSIAVRLDVASIGCKQKNASAGSDVPCPSANGTKIWQDDQRNEKTMSVQAPALDLHIISAKLHWFAPLQIEHQVAIQ